MFGLRLVRLAVVAVLLLMTVPALTPLSSSASSPKMAKRSQAVTPASAPSISIANSFIKASTSTGGRFIIGTTGGDPATATDDNKPLLFGYPSNVGSSFSTIRIVNNGTPSDYRLGATPDWDTTGIAPISPPVVNGNTILTTWQIGGVIIREALSLAQNAMTGRQDTTAIGYTITNNSSTSNTIGLRILLDDMIGGNDGAPIFVDGLDQITRETEWDGANVPSSWRAYESPTFDPSSLQGVGELAGDGATPPDRFVVARWSENSCGGAPGLFDSNWDYVPNPNLSITCDSAVALYYNPVTVAAGHTLTYLTYYGLGTKVSTPQVQLNALEVTQGIQNLANCWSGCPQGVESVPLIAGRTTLVRAYVSSTFGTVNGVSAELIGTRNGAPLPGSPLRPTNTGGTINVLQTPNRVTLSDSLNFSLLPSWLSGTITLQFQGTTTPITCADNVRSGHNCQMQVSFEPAPAISIVTVGVKYTDDHGVVHETPLSDIDEARKQIVSALPIANLRWQVEYDDISSLHAIGPTTLPFSQAVQAEIDTIFADLKRDHGFDPSAYYMALLPFPSPVPSGKFVTGQTLQWQSSAGLISQEVAWSFVFQPHDLGGNPIIFYSPSHEAGHLAGRDHTKSCTNDIEDPSHYDYPYPNGYISRDMTGNNAFYGLDMNTMTPPFPPDTGDLMGYCNPNWPSDWTYNQIYSALLARFGPRSAASSPRVPALAATGDSIMISGVLGPNGNTGTIGSIYEIAAQTTTTTPGSYSIQYLDRQGRPLGSYAFDPGIATDTSAPGPFVLVLPRNPSTATINLLHNGTVLDSRQAPSQPPSVQILYPNGGESLSGATATLRWSGSDPSGRPLQYVVQYSRDAGATWQTLATDWPSTTFTLDLDTVGGTNQGLLRVLASNGFYSTVAQSAHTFSVANQAPTQLSIDEPSDNSLFVGDQTIILRGSGYDNQDGQLGDSALTWSSNLNGVLGTGQTLAINASTLAEGTHTLTLTGKDSAGLTSSTRITVRISRSRPVLPPSLTASPSALDFEEAPGGGQIAPQSIAIRNDGDGVLAWSASANQSWINLSSPSGTAPTDVIVSVDPSNLAAGEYTGTITIAAVGATNSPQIIPVTLDVPARGPTITINTPTTTTYTLNQKVVASYSCADSNASVTSCAGTVPNGSLIDTSSVGAKTFTVTATDAAGLTVTQTVTYNVAYALCPRSRAASGLGTVIFQISLCDANGMDVSARTVGVHIVGVSPAPAQPIASAQLTFKYLPFAGYIDFVTTKGWASGPYTMMFSAGGDPTVHSLPFTAKNLPIP